MRKTIILVFGVIILQLNLSCKSQYSTTELNKNFTSEQVADLDKITEFFKSEMCLHLDSDFKTCFERTPHEYLEATGNPFWMNIDFEKQKKLYSQISQTTFNEIWSFGKASYPDSGLELKSIGAVYNGKYQKFLSDFGNHNKAIKKYGERIAEAGDFVSLYLTYWQILKYKKDFNLNDPNIQLIIAIHYLSLNDQEKRKDKWELE